MVSFGSRNCLLDFGFNVQLIMEGDIILVCSIAHHIDCQYADAVLVPYASQ